MPSNRSILLALFTLIFIDLALALTALFRGPFPIQVTLGSPLAYRNIYLHVPIAISTYALFAGALVSSVLYLKTRRHHYSRLADSFVTIGIIYAVGTLVTGSAWASESWGTPWNWDPKQTAVLLLFLAFLLYHPLKKSIADLEKSRQVAASYAIASFTLVPLSFLASRVMESLHPTAEAIGEFTGGGSGGMLLGPRILLMMAIGMLGALLVARGGARIPRLLPPALAVLGIVIALASAHPLLELEADRVLDARVDDQGRLTAIQLAVGGWVELEPPVESPIVPATTSEGGSSLVGHLVAIVDGGVRVLLHWSTPFTFAVYVLILAGILHLAYRANKRGNGP